MHVLGLNFESLSQYFLTVVVADAGGLIDTTTVTIDITDVNEVPVLVKSSGVFSTIPEDASSGQQTGLGIYAIDYDEGQNVTMSITAGNTGDVFTLTPLYDAGLDLTLYFFTLDTGKSLDFETQSLYNLQVRHYINH